MHPGRCLGKTPSLDLLHILCPPWLPLLVLLRHSRFGGPRECRCGPSYFLRWAQDVSWKSITHLRRLLLFLKAQKGLLCERERVGRCCPCQAVLEARRAGALGRPASSAPPEQSVVLPAHTAWKPPGDLPERAGPRGEWRTAALRSAGNGGCGPGPAAKTALPARAPPLLLTGWAVAFWTTGGRHSR